MPIRFFKDAEPAPDALRIGARYRPQRSEVPVKHVKFTGEGSRELARQIEAKAVLERARAQRTRSKPITVNDVLLRLLRRGLSAESQDGHA